MRNNKRILQIAAIDMAGNKFHCGDNKNNREQFLKYLKRKAAKQSGRLLVYAHNIQYDLGSIFCDELDCLDITMVGGRIIKAIWGNIEFRDSFNLWNMSVEKIGEAFGLEKLDFDPASKEYAFRDVEIIRKAILFSLKISNEFGIEKLPATSTSLGIKIWRAMGGEIWSDGSEFHRNAYYGGRTELFSPGGSGNIVYTDINSLYPSAMMNEFPGPVEATTDIQKFGVSEITIKIPDQFIAPLPVRREDDSIYYPVGKIKGSWTNHEIRNAVEHGAKILKLHESTGTNESYKPFEKYVSTFYERRLAAKDKASKEMYKLLMNSFYGHFGLSGEIIRSLLITEADKMMGFCDGIPYGRKKLCTQQIPLPETVNYLFAAYVTSYGRLRLQKYLRAIPEQDLIYCDTDSTIFFQNPKEEIPFTISSDLGEMKLESKEKYCRAFAPKVYIYGDEAKAKGVRKDLAKEFIKTGKASYSAPFKFREAVIFFDAGNSKPLSVWRTVTKVLRSKYDKKQLVKNHYYPLTHEE
jgi:hypothetical protein